MPTSGGQVRLPLGLPPVQAYLFHAYPLSVLAARQDYLPWLYSTFIQLYHLPDRELKVFVQPFSPGPCLRHAYACPCPWLDVQSLDQALLVETGALIPFLQRCLNRGLYPQVDVDYGRLPGHSPWGISPFLHEALLSGYDSGARTFELTGFDARGRFGPGRVTFRQLEQAAGAALHWARPSADAVLRDAGPHPTTAGDGDPRPAGWSPIDDARAEAAPWVDPAERPRLFLYRYVPEARFSLDPVAVAEQLADYLDAVNSTHRYRALVAPVGGLWGVGVYAYLEAAVAQRAEPSAPATGLEIPLRVLWEHKRLMADRLSFLERAGHLDPAGRLGARFSPVADLALQLRLVMLRWRHTRNATAIPTALDLLQQIASRESRLLGEALDQLLGRAACGSRPRPAPSRAEEPLDQLRAHSGARGASPSTRRLAPLAGGGHCGDVPDQPTGRLPAAR